MKTNTSFKNALKFVIKVQTKELKRLDKIARKCRNQKGTPGNINYEMYLCGKIESLQSSLKDLNDLKSKL